MIDINMIPPDVLKAKETLAMITEVEGSRVYVDMDSRREFLVNLADMLVDLISIDEFRKIDEAYLAVAEADSALTRFEDEGGSELSATGKTLHDAHNSAWENCRSALAQVLNRPVPEENN